MQAIRCPRDGQLLEAHHRADDRFECPHCDRRVVPEVLG